MAPPRTLSAVVLLALWPTALPAQQAEIKAQIEFAKSKVYPALVNIGVVTRSFEGGRTVRRPTAGSGTVISPAGHVITNYHVVEGAVRVTCTLPTGETIPAKVLANDPAIDFAVLQLELARRKNPNLGLPFATLGDSDRVSVGDYVLAVGNPLALSSSMTLGIVSNTRRVFTDFLGNEAEDLDIGGQKTGMFTLWIQTDALILPGNSGGAMVDLRGEIVGMNTRGGAGVGFATPANLLRKSLNQILTHGEVRRGWLGIDVQPSPEPTAAGALVAHVIRGSPAERAGIVVGDRILALDGKPLQCRFIEDLPLVYGAIAELSPGATVAVELAGGRKLQVPVEQWENFVASEREFRAIGVTVANVTRPMAAARGWPDADGVLITGIRPGKLLESGKPELARGDVIRSLDGKPVRTIADLETVFEDPKSGTKLAIGVRRDRQEIVAVVPVEEPQKRKPGRTLARAWIGVQTQVLVPDVATAIGMPGQKGLRVTRVLPDTRAAASGLRIGDVLVRLGDREIDAYRLQDAGDLDNLLDDFAVDQKVVLTVRRGAETLPLGIQLEASRLTAGDPETANEDFFEARFREITFADRTEQPWPADTTGAMVAECTNGGWAAMAGLRGGDLVQRVDGTAVAGPAEAVKALERARTERRALVVLQVRRGTRTAFVFIEPSYSN
jgi:serine protease Do